MCACFPGRSDISILASKRETCDETTEDDDFQNDIEEAITLTYNLPILFVDHLQSWRDHAWNGYEDSKMKSVLSPRQHRSLEFEK